MLAFAEDYLRRIRSAKSNDDVTAVLGQLAVELGYRSGFLIEYGATVQTVVTMFDSNTNRAGWWGKYIASGLRSTAPIVDLLSQDGIRYFSEHLFGGPDDPKLAFARKIDMVSTAVVPVSFDSKVQGMVTFCGERIMSSEQERAVQFVAISLFSQARSFCRGTVSVATANLTRREREVTALSSSGFTAQQVADQLGMSARTVNQHMENVAEKLGTRNRVHSVAEALRRDLL